MRKSFRALGTEVVPWGVSDFPFRLAVFDLDGTLLGPDKEISEANIAAVARLKEAGCKVVLASGRPHFNILRFHEQLGLDTPIVSGNGALVKVPGSEEVWLSRLLARELAVELLDLGAARGLTQIWDCPEGVFAWEQTPWSEVLATRTKSPVPGIGDPRLRFPDAPFKILWIADPETVAALDVEMRLRFGTQTYITITDPEYIEFSDPQVNKAAALQVIAEHWAISPDETVFFGDGDNDAELLRWAGLGIAMPHSRPMALAAADRIGPEAPPEDAVAAAVATLFA